MSIQICVITPTSHLQTFGSMGEFDMVLSHLVLKNGGSNPYTLYYQKQREKGRFIILDNSLFECEAQGVGVGIDACLDVAEIIKPNEVIAEDVLFDGPATIESTRQFIERMKERGVFGKYRVMGVVQGRTREEWFDCLEKLMDMPINTIGLSKLSVPMSFLGEKESDGCTARSRLMCTELLARKWCLLDRATIAGKQFHLLGGDNWTVWEMKQQTKYPWIRSNDSSCAVWYGRLGQTFDEDGKIKSIIMDKPDLENRDPATEQQLSTVDARAAVMENIARWHKACKGRVLKSHEYHESQKEEA